MVDDDRQRELAGDRRGDRPAGAHRADRDEHGRDVAGRRVDLDVDVVSHPAALCALALELSLMRRVDDSQAQVAPPTNLTLRPR